MKNSGFHVYGENLSKIPSTDLIKKQMLGVNATRWMIIVLNEWYFSTDMHFLTSFNFDTNVDVLIYDSLDGLILHKNLKSRNVIEETSDRHNDVVYAYKLKLQEILNDNEVHQSLTLKD